MSIGRTAVAFLFTSISLASCKKDDHTTIPSLRGIWQETEQGLQFAGSTYRVEFTEVDQFRLCKSLFTDALEPGKPCSRPRTQYMRGTYSTIGARLAFAGKYCDSTYSTDLADCADGAVFSEQYSMSGNFGQLILERQDVDYDRIILNRE